VSHQRCGVSVRLPHRPRLPSFPFIFRFFAKHVARTPGAPQVSPLLFLSSFSDPTLTSALGAAMLVVPARGPRPLRTRRRTVHLPPGLEKQSPDLAGRATSEPFPELFQQTHRHDPGPVHASRKVPCRVPCQTRQPGAFADPRNQARNRKIRNEIGAPGRSRTSDPRLRRPMLCPLSYGRVMGIILRGFNELVNLPASASAGSSRAVSAPVSLRFLVFRGALLSSCAGFQGRHRRAAAPSTSAAAMAMSVGRVTASIVSQQFPRVPVYSGRCWLGACRAPKWSDEADGGKRDRHAMRLLTERMRATLDNIRPLRCWPGYASGTPVAIWMPQ
jgi:hypothetical protein